MSQFDSAVGPGRPGIGFIERGLLKGRAPSRQDGGWEFESLAAYRVSGRGEQQPISTLHLQVMLGQSDAGA